jgi:hypothetical protein
MPPTVAARFDGYFRGYPAYLSLLPGTAEGLGIDLRRALALTMISVQSSTPPTLRRHA